MKIPPKVQPGDILEITWCDTNSPTSGPWMQEQEWKEFHPKMEMTSVGYLSEVSNGYIRLIADKSITKEYTALVARGFNIPVGCVSKIRKLR